MNYKWERKFWLADVIKQYNNILYISYVFFIYPIQYSNKKNITQKILVLERFPSKT